MQGYKRHIIASLALLAGLWGATAAAAPQVSQVVVADVRLKERLPAEASDVVLLYGGEWHGELGTCGCSVRPRGSLARAAGWRERLEKAGLAPLLLDVGEVTRAGASADAAWVKRALDAGRWDAVNVTPTDVVHWAELGPPKNAVSANVVGLAGVAPFLLRDVDGISVLITGVTAPQITTARGEGVRMEPPVSSLTRVLAQQSADVVVVLVWGLSESIDALILPGVDVLINGDRHPARYEPTVVGDTLSVRSREQSLRLGELHLHVTDGAIERAVDRRLDLDDGIPDSPAVRSVVREAERAAGR